MATSTGRVRLDVQKRHIWALNPGYLTGLSHARIRQGPSHNEMTQTNSAVIVAIKLAMALVAWQPVGDR